MNFTEKVKGFLLEPSKTFDAVKGERLSEAIKYYAIIAVIYSAIIAVLYLVEIGAWGAIIYFVYYMILAIIGAFIGGAVLHIFVYIVGGRKGIAETIKAVMYGFTPGLLLGWLFAWTWVILLIAAIWSLALEIFGIRQLHEITTGKAVLAVVLLIIVAVVLYYQQFLQQ